MTLIPSPDATARPTAADWFAGSEPWAIVDHMIGERVYRTHYFCRACCADLTDLRVHYVVACPYCTAALPHLLDGVERERAKHYGDWPYDLISARFSGWCSWHGFPEGGHPDDTATSRRLVGCALMADHSGPCRFRLGGRERPPTNPIRGSS